MTRTEVFQEQGDSLCHVVMEQAPKEKVPARAKVRDVAAPGKEKGAVRNAAGAKARGAGGGKEEVKAPGRGKTPRQGKAADRINRLPLEREKTVKAFQDYYPDDVSHCYGCGRLNERGLKVKSFWDGEESVATFQPRPYHMAIPGYVYGGLLASIVDCHGTGTAAAASYRAEGRAMDTEPPIRFLTASLQVDYVRPTPLGVPLEIRGRVKEIKGRKVVVSATVSADGEVCVRGEVVAVRVPERWMRACDEAPIRDPV